ncbi:MAG TPA: hypothetical protein VKI65_08705, partial [Gemmataceae bacterium]|nr:hypothetical protein [Gemmataceae bacterium]
NLPLKPAFVPLVLRLVSHVQRRPEVEGPSVVPADSVAEIAVAESWLPASAQVNGPGNRFSQLRMERSGSRLLGVFEGTSERGYYSVEVKGGRAEQRRAALSFAVNIAPDESEFAILNESQLRDLLPTDRLTVVDASAEAEQLRMAAGNEIPVWRWLIYLLFVLIGGEFLLATLGGRRREPGEELTVSERIRRYNPGTWVARMTGGTQKE